MRRRRVGGENSVRFRKHENNGYEGIGRERESMRERERERERERDSVSSNLGLKQPNFSKSGLCEVLSRPALRINLVYMRL